jgi:DNA polymerase elongation subunit (family B)
MKPTAVFDCEIYRDYFLVAFKNLATGNVVCFERLPDQSIDADKIQRILAAYTLISFNGNHFDLPVLAMALTGADNARIKQVCDDIIVGNKKSWEIYREYGLDQIECDHIDIIEVAPGQVGLKQYAGRLHAPTLQDLPIAPDATITPDQYPLLRQYCANDLDLTEQLYNHLLPQIDLRRRMTAEYGIDLRSKSDAQIAEAVIKAEVEKLNGGKQLRRTEVAPGTKLHYTPPDWVSFVTATGATVFNAVCDADYRIDQWGSPILPDSLAECMVGFHDTHYTLGIGGLHSTESKACHHADADTLLVDRDVASYYPSIILRCGLAPTNMGEHFLPVYAGIVQRRLAAKAAGDKVTDAALKICINGSFGKLGSKWSVLYAPALFLQVTLTGQLALLMLIERLEQHGIRVVSANTDGVVIKCPRAKVAEMDAIVCWWETTTGFDTDAAHYAALYSRDVNNYIAIKTDGSIKTKGAYATTTLMKSPQNEICTTAVIDYLRNGTPVQDTITWCEDIRKFLTLRQVKGGAVWKGQPLGRVVRWYYSRADGAPITYASNGNKVARSDGAKACQTLPAAFPADVDLDWYIAEAESMLADLGLVVATKQEEIFA